MSWRAKGCVTGMRFGLIKARERTVKFYNVKNIA